MLGGIIGDIVGSRFEFAGNKSEDFELFTGGCKFTDDTVMLTACADSILNNKSFAESYKYWGTEYPNMSYGAKFNDWLHMTKPVPYKSYGNGSAMRVSPVGWTYDRFTDVINNAKRSAIVTHNHKEGVRGACAVAVCIYLARYKTPKHIIKDWIETYFYYNLSRDFKEVKSSCVFNESCQVSVPEAIQCFLEGKDFEDVIRKTVGLGGDADTQGCIAGSIAEAYYGIPESIISQIEPYLSYNGELNKVLFEFYKRYDVVTYKQLKKLGIK